MSIEEGDQDDGVMEDEMSDGPGKSNSLLISYLSSQWMRHKVQFCWSSVAVFVLDNILKRVFNIVKFSWVLFLALMDSFTAWLNSICQEHIDISTVLRIERCMLTQEVKKVLVANNPMMLCSTENMNSRMLLIYVSLGHTNCSFYE